MAHKPGVSRAQIVCLVGLFALLSPNLFAQTSPRKRAGTGDAEIANRAFAAWQKGENSGDYSDFKTLLSPGFALFSHPLQPSRGTFKGATARLKMNALIATREKAPNQLRFSNVVRTQNEVRTQNQTTFVFLFDSEGKVAGGFPYRGWNALAFTIKNRKISGFREYFGDVEPNWFKSP